MASSLYIRYDIWMRWQILIDKYTIYDNIYNTGVWFYLLLEVIINLIAPYHYFEDLNYVEMVEVLDYEVTYPINDLLLCFSFIRLYLIVKFSLYSTEFMNPRSQRVC